MTILISELLAGAEVDKDIRTQKSILRAAGQVMDVPLFYRITVKTF